MTDDRGSAALRDELLEATLPHVPFDGWTWAALRRGAQDSGHDPDAARLAFPHGASDMIEYFSLLLDRRMLEALDRADLGSMGMTRRIATGVRTRLELAAPYRDAVQQAIAFLALPQNAPLGARCLYRTVDAVWRAAGDTATDWNFYSKRGLLAGVYGATVLYWLGDRSDGFADTWSFLDRRLADVVNFGKATGRLKERVSGLSRGFNPYRTGRRESR